MREDRETVIAGRTVRVSQFSVWRALPMWLRVGNALAPLTRSLDAMQPGDLVKLQALKGIDDLDPAVLLNTLPAFAGFFEQLSVPTIMEIAGAVLAGTVVTVPGEAGKPDAKIQLTGEAQINAAFGTDVIALVRAIWFALSVNFASSFRQSGFSEAARA